MRPEVAEELESSSNSDSQDVTEQSSSSDVEPQSIDDAIRDALQTTIIDDEGEEYQQGDEEPEVEEATDSSAEVESEVGDPQGEEPAAVSDDDFIQQLKDNEIPLGKVERFQQILEERNQARTERDELTSVKSQLAEIQTAGQDAGLSTEQLTDLFSLPMLLKHDPAQAKEVLGRFSQFVGSQTGEHLDSELQQKVDDGYMDEASAKELAQARAARERVERQAEQQEQRRQQEAAQTAQQSVVNAVNTFGNSLKESDPDYSFKEKYVQRELKHLVDTRGYPKSPEQAVEWAKEAHQTVSKDFGAMKPAPKPKRVLSGRTQNRTAPTEPANMFEAISAVVGGVTTED